MGTKEVIGEMVAMEKDKIVIREGEDPEATHHSISFSENKADMTPPEMAEFLGERVKATATITGVNEKAEVLELDSIEEA